MPIFAACKYLWICFLHSFYGQLLQRYGGSRDPRDVIEISLDCARAHAHPAGSRQIELNWDKSFLRGNFGPGH